MKKACQKFLHLKLPWTNFVLESSWNFLNEKGRPEYPIFCKLSSTEFDLESNWNFLNEKCRPKILISSQTLHFEFHYKSIRQKCQTIVSLVFYLIAICSWFRNRSELVSHTQLFSSHWRYDSIRTSSFVSTFNDMDWRNFRSHSLNCKFPQRNTI